MTKEQALIILKTTPNTKEEIELYMQALKIASGSAFIVPNNLNNEEK